MLTADTTKSTSGVYTCQTCNSLFTCLDYYQQHRKNHAEAEGVKLLTCAHCTYVSDNAFHFNWHIMSHASSAPHRCEVCTPLQFTNQTSTNCNGDLVNGGDGSGVGGNGSNGFGSTGTGTRISDPIVGFGKRSIATDTNDDLISYSSPSYQSSASSSASSTTNSSKSTTAITTRREDIYTNLQTIDASELLDDTTKNDIDNDDDCNNEDNCDNNNEQQNILLQVQQAYSETNEEDEDEDESEDSDDDEESESEQQPEYDDTNFAQQHSIAAADSFKDFEDDDNTLKSDSNLNLASIEQQLISPNIKLELDEEDEEEAAMENNEYGDNQSRELVMDTIHQDEVGQDFEEGVGDEQETDILNSNDYESQQEQIADEYEDSVYDGGDDGNATTTADDEDCNELTSVTSLKPVQSDATTIDDVYEFTSDDEHIESVSMIPRCLPPNSSSSSNLQQLSSFVQQHANSQLQQQSSATVPTSGVNQTSPKPPQPAAPAINTSTAEHNPQPQLQPFFTHHPMNNFLTIHNSSFSPNSAANQFLNQHAAAFANGTPQGAQLRFVSIPFANHPQAQQQLPPSAVPQQQAQPVRTQHHNQYTSQNVLRKTKTTNNSIAPLTPTSSGDTLSGTIQTNGVTPLGIDAFVPTKGKGKGNRKPRINFISVVNGITVGADGIRRKFHCSHCGNGKSFKTKSHLQRHMLTHTGEKPYQCNECGAKFNQSSSLRNHIIAIHTKKFPHTCTICGKGFLMPAVLQKHIQTTGHQSLMPDVSLMDLSPGTSTISQNENNSMMMMGEDGCGGGGIVGGSDGGGEDNSNNLNDIITDEDDIEDYEDDNNHEDEDGDDIEEDEEEDEDEEEQNDHNFTHNNNNLAQLNNSAANLFDGSHNLHHHLLEPHHSHRTDMIAAAKSADMLFLPMNSTNS